MKRVTCIVSIFFLFISLSAFSKNKDKELASILERLDPGLRYVTGDIKLPSPDNKNIQITWSSNDDRLMDANGKVTRPAVGMGDKQVLLTATVSTKKSSAVKSFPITVAEEEYGYLMSYILPGETGRTNSFFIAAGTDGKQYTALNNDKAVVYPLEGSKKLRSPRLFRKPDGSFGLIAIDSDREGMIVYHSPDLISYEDEKYLTLNEEGIHVREFICTYDNLRQVYAIKWIATNGDYYESTTRDFQTIETNTRVPAFLLPEVPAGSPDGATDRSVIGLTKNEYDRVVRKYGKITNTAMAAIPSVSVRKGSPLQLPAKVTAEYSDGSTKQMGVVWDSADIDNMDLNTPGTYTVKGVVQQPDYTSPLVRQRADPWVFKGDDGYYYFTASYPMVGENDPEGYDRVILRRAETIEGLAEAEEISIWQEKECPSCFRYVWAPEIHQIEGTWYVFFTTSVSRNVWHIRPRIISCTLGERDPYNPECWENIGQLMEPAAGDEYSFTHFSLDMTHFSANGKHYVVWAEKPNTSDILIASVDGKAPWKVTSNYTLLTKPEYAWEHDHDTWVNEGPAVIKNNGKVYLAYSASAVNHTYCVGLLYADEQADLLNPASWTKLRYPVLSTEDLPADQNGPGHNSFTVDQYGNPVIVYHARNPEETIDGGLYDPGRHAFAKSVHFAFDGTPVLNMTREQELAPENKQVTIEVIVSE
ncbi:MAG: family 43 glycosylhydrolase [Tannerellaceae bacterium]|nr:family 43 glycosylhydrolase [Tannerellaceae bacterium]